MKPIIDECAGDRKELQPRRTRLLTRISMSLAVRRIRRGLLGAALLAAASLACLGQARKVRQLSPRPRPELTLTGTITVSATPAAVNFALVSGGTATGA